jgi:hypothetical protein
MTYVLPEVACDEEELHTVQAAFIPSLLQNLGAYSKYPLALRHGPTLYAGLDIADLRTESGVYLLKAVIRSLPIPRMVA